MKSPRTPFTPEKLHERKLEDKREILKLEKCN